MSSPRNPKNLLAALTLVLGIGGGTQAVAAPVFDGAGLSEDAVSPNQDNVQDFTIIDYTVQVDSADVRVQLTPLGGGPVVGVLAPFTRRALGLHTLVFDGTIGGNPVDDGSYQVEVLGIGSQGEGPEQIDLPLGVDRVAPVIESWGLVSAGFALKNGDTVTLQACVNADAETLIVDLTPLDSDFNPGAILEEPGPVGCRRFTYTISPNNTRQDFEGPAAFLSVRDGAGNTAADTLDLCLSNFPPIITSATLLSSSEFLQDGDPILVRVEVASPNTITATGEFGNLDSGFNSDNVTFSPAGNQQYDISYAITTGNTRNDGVYPLHLRVEDQGCGVARDSSLTIILDNAGVKSSLLDNISVTPEAFSPRGNGFKTVNIDFDVLEDLEDSVRVAVTVEVDLINPERRETVIIQTLTLFSIGPHTIIWDGNGAVPTHTPDRLKDQKATIRIRATSRALDQERDFTIPFEIDNTPPELTLFPPPSSVKARNTGRVNIPVSYDRPGNSLIADFSFLDSNFNPQTSSVAAPDSGDGRYGIFYTVSATNTVRDTTEIPVPLTAIDPAGNFASTDLVRVCLNNLPPVFESADFLGDPGPFKNGERIVFETTWTTESNQSPLIVTADFSAVDENFDPVDRPATVLNRDNNVFEISYTVSSGNGIEEGTRLPVYVTAEDDLDLGCGSTTVEAIYINLDSRPGPQPTLSAASQVTANPSVGLSGRAAEAVMVQIQRSNVAVDTFQVNSDSTFTGTIPLSLGSNTFTARGIDAAGNVSPPSRPVEIFRAAGTILEIPNRFAPGDEFFLALLEPADRITVRVFNLEGTELQRVEGGSGTLVRIAWDGRDTTGNLLSSGPYLAVVEVEDGGSIRERLRKAFVFTRRGVEQ